MSDIVIIDVLIDILPCKGFLINWGSMVFNPIGTTIFCRIHQNSLKLLHLEPSMTIFGIK